MPTPYPRPRRLGPWAAAAGLLLLPALAMQVTDAVNWGPGDVLAAAFLLALGLAAWEVARRLARRPGPRVLAELAIGAVVLAAWAELAVGVLTDLGS